MLTDAQIIEGLEAALVVVSRQRDRYRAALEEIDAGVATQPKLRPYVGILAILERALNQKQQTGEGR